ncbi:MAG: glycosylase [Chitinophagaceae bacterium]|nr:glycosylase [Chitinophagaceae bacterium]MCW5927990.1 glycosylase [Chitinophagaceae bacterium]
MKYPVTLYIALILFSCNTSDTGGTKSSDTIPFPAELVRFVPYEKDSLFSGTDTTTWDRHIRERGFILKEDGLYNMWYTGYSGQKGAVMQLGYATSPDGIHWQRFESNPIHTDKWVEDMFVIKHEGLYYMFAEGRGDTAHLMSSADKIRWTELGDLDVRQVNGEPIEKGPFGTPTAWYEDGTWYLFYERNDLGIWLATSKDMKTWTNVQDDPVIAMGPGEYDKYAVAVNQVIKHNGYYYAYYHGSAFEDWREWSNNIAASRDLVHWEKYSGNPILGDDTSSGIVVPDGKKFRMYTMHKKVQLFLPEED